MEKVTTINLAGNSFQLEELGFEKLSAYLAEAKTKLSENPDAAEIIADIEAALASKCRTYLSPHKTVITTIEIEKILAEMGPVEDSEGDASEKKGAENPPKRLYRIREGSMISGVCTGLGAYFNIDVTLVRLVFVVLLFVTSGGWAVAYIIMAMVIPVADTPEKKAEAHGAAPITAQGLIDQAKRGYEHIRSSEEWSKLKDKMKHEGSSWQKNWHKAAHNLNNSWEYREPAPQYQYYYSPLWSFMHSVLGLIWTVLIVYALYLAYAHIPVAHQFMDTVGLGLQKAADSVAAWVQGW